MAQSITTTVVDWGGRLRHWFLSGASSDYRDSTSRQLSQLRQQLDSANARANSAAISSANHERELLAVRAALEEARSQLSQSQSERISDLKQIADREALLGSRRPIFTHQEGTPPQQPLEPIPRRSLHARQFAHQIQQRIAEHFHDMHADGGTDRPDTTPVVEEGIA